MIILACFFTSGNGHYINFILYTRLRAVMGDNATLYGGDGESEPKFQ